MRSLLDEPLRFLRISVPLLFFFYALSGVWRFEEGTLGAVSAAAWAVFYMVLLSTLAFVIALLVRRVTTRA